jgi:hypothetical protein
MRMSVQVPRSMMGAIPDPHGVVTNHNGLAMYRDFRKVAEPRELLGKLANLFVVITRHRKDLLAASLLAVLQSLRLAPDAEIPKEIQDVIGLNGGVETVEDRLIHFLDASKRSITVADYVAMPKMKIRREPSVRHVSCELPGDLAEHHATVPFRVRDIPAVLFVGGLGRQRESCEAAVVPNFCVAAEKTDERYFVLIHESVSVF